jgi:RecB family exonuclease
MLPGLPPHRGAAALPDDAPDGAATVRVLPTVAKEAAYIANELRRAHLVDGVPWSSMAVIVRSVPLSVAPLRRALSAAGVPVGPAASELPLAYRRGAHWLLLILRVLSAPAHFTGDEAMALVAGPVGGADPVSMRRLRRGLRRAELAAAGERESAELLRVAMLGGEEADRIVEGLTEVESTQLRRVRAVLGKAAGAMASPRAVEEVLWAAWQATGLARRWSAASLRGGPAGAQADRDLDAVVALFDAAANYVDRLPRATIVGFVDYVEQQQFTTDTSARAAPVDGAVAILTPHAAAGREFDVVAVAGVQDGIWPNLRPRGSLLQTEALVDLCAGVAEPGERVSRTAPLLADERRLLLVAASRARRVLLVTAVESTSGDRDLLPSRFIDELAARHGRDDSAAPRLLRGTGRLLALSALVGELRAVVCDPEIAAAQPDRHRRAAAELARLAAAGVRGAHPDQWYGLGGASVADPLWHPQDGPVPLSPSAVEQLTSCSLRWALERNGGSDGDNVRAVGGTVVHALVQAMAGGVARATVDRELDSAWETIDMGSGWYSRRELERTRRMLDNFEKWLSNSRGELTEVGVEVGVECVLPPREEDDPAVRIRGRIDRLERDADGRLVIVDVKTGKNAVTKAEAQEHAQLATYQVAAAEGGIDGETAGDPGGGRLVYVAKSHNGKGATEGVQSPLDAEGVQRWRDTIRDAAATW